MGFKTVARAMPRGLVLGMEGALGIVGGVEKVDSVSDDVGTMPVPSLKQVSTWRHQNGS